MRRTQFWWLRGVLVVGVGLWVIPSLSAEPASAPASVPEAKPPAAQTQQTPTAAELRAQIHSTLAELWQEQAKAQPDQAKIAQLQKQVMELRTQLQTNLWASGQNVPPAGAGVGGPMAGPAWGGPGLGPRAGFGPGAGMGRGYGPGMGIGRGGPWFVDRNQNGICDYWEAAHGVR